MGRYVEIKVINQEELINKTIKLFDGKPKKEEVKQVFDFFMIPSGENYILLNNEFDEEHNSYYNVITVINVLFDNGTDDHDWHSNVLLMYPNCDDACMGIYEYEEKFNVEIEEVE